MSSKATVVLADGVRWMVSLRRVGSDPRTIRAYVLDRMAERDIRDIVGGAAVISILVGGQDIL